MWDDPPRPTEPAKILSLLVLALAISGYVLCGWSLVLLHRTPTAPPACAHATAQASASSLQEEVFVGVTSEIERPAYRISVVVDANTAICVARASDGAIIKSYPLGENTTLLGLTQNGGVLYYLLGTNPNTSQGVNSQSSLCAMRASNGARLWCHSVSHDYTNTQITINNGILYLANQTQGPASLMAVRASDGAVLWKQQAWRAQFAVANSTVYLLASDTQVCAASASDGTTRWCTPQSLQAQTLAIAADSAGVYLLGRDDSVSALRPDDGSLQWQRAFPGTLSLPSYPPPVLIAEDGILYSTIYDPAISSQAALAAFRTSDGTTLWETGARLPLAATVESGGIVYLVSEGGRLQALEAQNGAPIWQENVQSSQQYRLVLGGGRLYLLDNQGSVYAFNTSDGRPLWEQTQCAAGSSSTSPQSNNGALSWCKWGTDSVDTGSGWSTQVSTNGGLYAPGFLAPGA